MTATTVFRRLHDGPAPLLLANAWDHASAAAFAAHGFPAVGTTSLGIAAARGVPDAAGATRAETLALARRLAGLAVPVSVDLEHGFSEDPDEVGDLAAELADLGVAGVNLEDGRPDGSLVARDRHARTLAAVRARAPELFVNARTDTAWLHGERADLADTLDRGRAYLAAGADGVFVPGALSTAWIATLAAELPGPLNVLVVPGGHRVARLAELGVRRVSFGSLLFRVALGAAVGAVSAIRAGEPLPSTTPIPTYPEVDRLAAGAAPAPSSDL
jgi:2-methylisocitrate lyase-like PEP mutase family enzyme